jgi:hypothetical protein
MKIGGNFDQPYNLQGQAAFLKRLPGLAVQLQEVPYNHSVDGAPDRLTQELIDQDAAWDAKRGTKVCSRTQQCKATVSSAVSVMLWSKTLPAPHQN